MIYLRSSNIVLVTGTPGARTYVVVQKLMSNGYAVLWPGQELLTEDAKRFFEHNKQNIEVHNIHKGIMASCDRYDLFTDDYPAVDTSSLLLEPLDFFIRFPEQANIVISDNLLSIFLSLWAPFSTTIIDIIASEEQDMRTLSGWVRGSTDKLSKIRQVFIDTRQQAINTWKHQVITLKDEELETALGR